MKRLIRLLGPICIVAAVYYLGSHAGYVYSQVSGDGIQRVIDAVNALSTHLSAHWREIYLWGFPFQTGICTAIFFAIIVILHRMTRLHAYGDLGSSRWATRAEISRFANRKFSKNILLSQDFLLDLYPKASGSMFDRNKNICVLGGPGSGKTYGFFAPNVCQMEGSYVIVDPKGTIAPRLIPMLEKNGYDCLLFSTVNPMESMHFNLFDHIHEDTLDQDVLDIVDCIISATQEADEKRDFWTKAEKLWLTAAIGFVAGFCPKEDQTMQTVMDLLLQSEVSETDETMQSVTDIIFADAEKENPDHFAVQIYKLYRKAAGISAKSVLFSLGNRLNPFLLPAVKSLTSDDNLDIECIATRKTAVFLTISDSSSTFEFLSALILHVIVSQLRRYADEHGGQLKIPVQFMLDELANIGRIPNLVKLVATLRSRGISFCLGLQSPGQLEEKYGKSAQTIIDSCDSYVFLGGKSTKTTKDIADQLGAQTVTTHDLSRQDKGSVSSTEHLQHRSLLDASEIGRLPRSQSIVLVTGIQPWKGPKFDFTRHPHYKETGYYSKGPDLVDMQKWLQEKKHHKSPSVEDMLRDISYDKLEIYDYTND